MLLTTILAGCPAEMLGIELPPPGAGAVSMDDLQRDTRGASAPDWRAFVTRRFGEMHLRVDDGVALCGSRGSGPERAFVAPEPVDADGAANVAVLISLAKAADTTETPAAWRFCVGVAEGVALGPFGPGPLAPDGARAGPADPHRRLESFDYRVLAAQTVAVWERYGGAP